MKKRSDFYFDYEYETYLASRKKAKESKWYASQHYLLYKERV